MSFHIFSQEVKVEGYTEGTITKFSEYQRNEIQSWKASTLQKLYEGLSETSDMRKVDAYEKLVEIAKQIVSESFGEKESFMRFALNRGLFISNLITEKSKNSRDQALYGYHFMRRAFKVAIKFNNDSYTFESVRSEKFSEFGYNFAEEFLRVNANIVDLELNFMIYHKIFEMFAWDLFQDKSNQKYARLVLRITDVLNELNPEKGFTDYQSGIRELNLLRDRSFENFMKNEYENYLLDYNKKNFREFYDNFRVRGYFTNDTSRSYHYSQIYDGDGEPLQIKKVHASQMRLRILDNESLKIIVRPKGGGDRLMKVYGTSIVLVLSKKDGLLRTFKVVYDSSYMSDLELVEIGCRYRLEKRKKNVWTFENVGKVHYKAHKKKKWDTKVDILEICPLSFNYKL